MVEGPRGSSAVLCALVVVSSAGSAVDEVVVPFSSAPEADGFARRHGLEGRVVPLRFAVVMDRELSGSGGLAAGGRR